MAVIPLTIDRSMYNYSYQQWGIESRTFMTCDEPSPNMATPVVGFSYIKCRKLFKV